MMWWDKFHSEFMICFYRFLRMLFVDIVKFLSSIHIVLQFEKSFLLSVEIRTMKLVYSMSSFSLLAQYVNVPSNGSDIGIN